jgi:hypothetical protein
VIIIVSRFLEHHVKHEVVPIRLHAGRAPM